MAVEPAESHATNLPRAALRPFRQTDAPLVASWIGPDEAYWLAPRSRAPLTVETVLAWGQAEGQRFVLVTPDAVPVAYGEVNRLNFSPRTSWLGHLVVAPTQRRRGFGQRLARSLIDHAFDTGVARRVTLVVFPENAAAIACYRAVGMRADGFETHFFPHYRRRVRLLRLAISAAAQHH